VRVTVSDVFSARFEWDFRRPAAQPVRRWERQYVSAIIAVDVCAALVAGVVAYRVRFTEDFPASEPYLWLSVALPWLWLASIGLCRAYEARFLGIGSEEFRRVMTAGVWLIAAVGTSSWATKAEVARGYVVLALPLTIGLTVCGRYVARKRLHALRRRGACMQRVVAVGHGPGVADLVRQVKREPYHGLEIIAACLPEAVDCPDLAELDIPVAGTFDDVCGAVDVLGADTVAVLTCREMDGPALRRLSWELERQGTDLIVAPALMEVAGPRIAIRPVSGLPLLHVEQPELTGGRRLAKGLVDRTVALLALVLLLPLLLGVGLLVRLTSPGPALFRQTRVGRHGEEFTMVKFRTMVQDAEARRADVLHLNELDGVLFKMRSDPRITRIGGWLRRFSLDELPQLINVLKGDMSLVGPRPPLPEEVALYGDDVLRRLLVKPGLTGLWQISGRSDLSWDESVRLDLRYVENWSLALDALIVWKTVFVVARGSGAY
jgi:exopolysaccharide biosynthesis polyprenyl glycosylphosphotransferase